MATAQGLYGEYLRALWEKFESFMVTARGLYGKYLRALW